MADVLSALRQQFDRFPAAVSEKLRAVAWRKSREVKDIAKRLAPRSDGSRGKHTSGNPHLGDSIVIVEDAEQKKFAVFPETPWLPMLGMWVELGTVKMRARPFMRPAGDQVNASYQREMIDAANSAADEAFR